MVGDVNHRWCPSNVLLAAPLREPFGGAAFGGRLDFAQLQKVYAAVKGNAAAVRYSLGDIIDTKIQVVSGHPDDSRICTRHAERHNLTIRTPVRRMTRLTNAFSKKWENHEAALALFFAYYNFCRVHGTLKTAPAVAAGLADHIWNVSELLKRIATQSQDISQIVAARRLGGYGSGRCSLSEIRCISRLGAVGLPEGLAALHSNEIAP